ncbi:MAG: ABC transporter permease subunit [Clostridia bacterium]|nr:ABC transporter permease subunit [Clostridia bacterium]
MNKKKFSRFLAVLLVLAIWQAAAMAVGIEILLVSPWTVAVRLFHLVFERDFWPTVFFSILRISAGFSLGFLLGTLLAVAAGRSSLMETLLWPYVTGIKSIPVASFIIISLIWLKNSQLAVFISFLMVFPVIYSNVLQGIKSTDPALLEMASLYRVPWKRKMFYIYIPAIRPFLLSACSVSLGMSWKAGIAAEVIGVVRGSIGEKLYDAKIYFLTADLFAWTVMIVLISVLFEKTILVLIRRIFKRMENR